MGSIGADYRLHEILRQIDGQHHRSILRKHRFRIAFGEPAQPGALATFDHLRQDHPPKIIVDERLLLGTRPEFTRHGIRLPDSGRWQLIRDTVMHESVHARIFAESGSWNDQRSHTGRFAEIAAEISPAIGLTGPRPKSWSGWPQQQRDPRRYVAEHWEPW